MRTRSLLSTLVLLSPLASSAQTPPTPPPEPPAPTAQPPAGEPESQPPAEPPLPSLDDLLGLPKQDPASKRPPAVDPAQADLERKLSMAEAAEEFRQAVQLMGETADRIAVSRDTGLVTQRLQEDIVRKLDQLIKAAEQQAQQSRRSRSSSSQNNNRNPQQQPAQQQGEQNEPGNRENRGETNPPGRVEGPLNPELAARGAAWGALAPHVRDALIQGQGEVFSAFYKRITEAYYRKIAEEAR